MILLLLFFVTFIGSLENEKKKRAITSDFFFVFCL